MSNNKTFKAEILTINDEVRTKNLKEGLTGSYLLCTVKFLEGGAKGKEYFAQRTLKTGKAPIHVGQEVTLYMTLGTNGNPFFEISTGGNVCDTDELKNLLGL